MTPVLQHSPPKLLGPPLYRSGFYVGDLVVVDHPGVEAPVRGVVSGEVPKTGLVVLRLEATAALVLVPVEMVSAV